MTSIENPTDLIAELTTPEELRGFLNGGAIERLASLLDLASNNKDPQAFSLTEDGAYGESTTYWLEQERKRIFVVQNSLSRLPGLFLNLPVRLDEYELAPGNINATYVPTVDGRRVPEPYSQGSGMPPVAGNPNTVVKIMLIAKQELSAASGILSAEDI